MTMLGPFNIADVIERIESQGIGFRVVAGAAEAVSAQRANVPTTPAAFVFLAQERGQGIQAGSLQVQPVRAQVAVLIAAQNYRRSDLGASASKDAWTLASGVREALVGWKPDSVTPGGFGFRLVDARLLEYSESVVWWQETFETEYTLRTH